MAIDINHTITIKATTIASNAMGKEADTTLSIRTLPNNNGIVILKLDDKEVAVNPVLLENAIRTINFSTNQQ